MLTDLYSLVSFLLAILVVFTYANHLRVSSKGLLFFLRTLAVLSELELVNLNKSLSGEVGV